MKLPGFKYEKKHFTTLTNRNGELLMHIGIETPFITIGRFKPTNTLTWIIHGTILSTVTILWVLTAGLILGTAGIFIDFLEESFNNMKKR